MRDKPDKEKDKHTSRAGAIHDSIIRLRFKITNFEKLVIGDSNFI